MKRIFKYNLGLDDVISIDIPIGAEILTVQSQNNSPCLWALVDEDAETERVTFRTFDTGQPIPPDGDFDMIYIGTYQIYEGDGVFHVFLVESDTVEVTD